MTTLAQDINELLAASGVTAVVGEKIYPGMAPQNTVAPYVVWRRNGGDPMSVLSGSGRTRRFINLLIYCFSAENDYDKACDLADAVHDAIVTGTGKLKGTCNPPVDGFEPETRLFSVILEARLFHKG